MRIKWECTAQGSRRPRIDAVLARNQGGQAEDDGEWDGPIKRRDIAAIDWRKQAADGQRITLVIEQTFEVIGDWVGSASALIANSSG